MMRIQTTFMTERSAVAIPVDEKVVEGCNVKDQPHGILLVVFFSW